MTIPPNSDTGQDGVPLCEACQEQGLPADHRPGTCPQASQYRPGGAFILDSPPEPVPLWGDGQEVLHAEGEALMIVGPQGIGKTTLMQQYALARCGFPEYATLLGYPVVPNKWGRVLYLAFDRPWQVARSFRRMVGEAWRDELDSKLVVWEGPPLRDLAKHDGLLLSMARYVAAEAETIIVDSIKDAAIGLSDDEVGAAYNRARQKVLNAGIEVVEGHHQRKAIAGQKAAAPSIDSVYGSTWITSGVGSVLMLTGSPGDVVVGLHHLKQPASEVGPFQLWHDHQAGQTSVFHEIDLVLLARVSRHGMTVVDAAGALFAKDKPTANQKEKARRRLDHLVSRGELVVLVKGDPAANQPTRWGVL